MEETSNALRRRAQSHRRALPSHTWFCWSRLIQAQTLEQPQYLAANSVVLYSPVDNEVDTRAIMEHALSSRKKVYYPVLRGTEVPEFAQVYSQNDFIRGPYGIPEPAGDVRLKDADCERLALIVPGLVFDRRGYRLGRGRGWYDRALAWIGQRACSFGLAFEFQLVDRLPERSWDQKLDCVITETEVISCGNVPQLEVSR
jgi:5-formyltetrahydrofolate cyclo-ligase